MTLLPPIAHPGMSVAQFDALTHKAHMNDLRVTEVVKGIVFVTSASRTNRVHRVTRTTCDCEGHKAYGRCMHRCYAIFLADCCGGFAQPAPVPANVVRFPMRHEPLDAA